MHSDLLFGGDGVHTSSPAVFSWLFSKGAGQGSLLMDHWKECVKIGPIMTSVAEMMLSRFFHVDWPFYPCNANDVLPPLSPLFSVMRMVQEIFSVFPPFLNRFPSGKNCNANSPWGTKSLQSRRTVKHFDGTLCQSEQLNNIVRCWFTRVLA